MSEHPRGGKKSGVVGGRFRIQGYLGEGGMGEVYAASHLITGAEVALKFLLPQHAADETLCRRFAREARAAAAIQHPNVIAIRDVFDDHDDTPVIVMELLKGETLGARLKRAGELKLQEAAEVFLGVAGALVAAHDVGIVHRDLKPENIFLVARSPNEPAFAKVLDFGIAKILDAAQLEGLSHASSTGEGALLGTIPYMSFEQAMGLSIDARTDVWSFGVVMVEALSRRRPLQYQTISEMYVAMLQQRVSRVHSLLPELPMALAGMLDACLAKEPDKRAKDLKHVVTALGDHLAQRSPRAVGRGRAKRSIAIGLCVVGALAAVLTFGRAIPRRPAPERRPAPNAVVVAAPSERDRAAPTSVLPATQASDAPERSPDTPATPRSSSQPSAAEPAPVANKPQPSPRVKRHAAVQRTPSQALPSEQQRESRTLIRSPIIEKLPEGD